MATALTGAAIVSLYLLALAFPEPLFAYSLSHENFRVYCRHSVDPRLREILDEVNRRLSRSEINTPAPTHRVFILDSPVWNASSTAPIERPCRDRGSELRSSHSIEAAPNIGEPNSDFEFVAWWS